MVLMELWSQLWLVNASMIYNFFLSVLIAMLFLMSCWFTEVLKVKIYFDMIF